MPFARTNPAAGVPRRVGWHIACRIVSDLARRRAQRGMMTPVTSWFFKYFYRAHLSSGAAMKLNEASCGGSSWWQPRLRAAHFALVAILACATLAGAAQPAPSDALPGDQQPLPPDPRPVLDQAGPALGAADPTAASDDMEVLRRAGARSLCRNGLVKSAARSGRAEGRTRSDRGAAAGSKARRETTSPGFPATGRGMTSAATFCGSAASGGPCRRVASGCPATGAARQGQQWVSGYWADAQASEVEYLPQPPATLEVGPSTVAISNNQTWIPGTWIWNVSLRVATRLLDPATAKLGLGAGVLCLGARRVHICERLLGLRAERPGRALRRSISTAAWSRGRGSSIRRWRPSTCRSSAITCSAGPASITTTSAITTRQTTWPAVSIRGLRRPQPRLRSDLGSSGWTHRNDRDFVRTVESGYRDLRDHVEHARRAHGTTKRCLARVRKANQAVARKARNWG